MTKTIPLTQGKYAVVDDSDYEAVSQFVWQAKKGSTTWYASTTMPNPGGKRKRVMLHRFILNAPDGVFVDHKDGNGLLCTRENMRLCEPFENARNTRRSSANKSGYKGVSWRKKNQKWVAQIRIGHSPVCLGYFDDPKEAALVYDEAARRHYGEFAKPNFGENSLLSLPEPPTREDEAFHRRLSRVNRSGYIGVSSHGNGWRVSIQVEREMIYLGSFSSPEEASHIYDEAARRYFGETAKTNWPADYEVDIEDIKWRNVLYANNKSGYRGVTRWRDTNKWTAQIRVQGKNIHLGYFSSPEQAAKAWDHAARKYKPNEGKLNFPDEFLSPRRGSRLPKSGYYGVDQLPSGQFRARIIPHPGGKPVHLGTFDTPEAAARAWDAAAIHYRGKGTRTNFPQDEEE